MPLPVVPRLGYCRGVAHEPSQGAEQVRAAEVIGALCLATDLGMGFPFEHGLQSTLVAARLADRLGVDSATTSQAYYACLLSHAGCTTDAHVTAEVFGGSLTTHLNPVLYGSQRDVLTGLMRALPESDSPAPVRALQVARGLPKIARLQRPHFTAMCEVAQMLADGVGLPLSIAGLLAYLTERWDGKGPLRRAALVHDLGRVAIGARTWQRARPLTVGEWEQVRLHPYQTERVISRSLFLSALAPVAGAHHERLDGSGYHRGSAGAELPLPARVLAAADAYQAMTEPRPHREPLPPERAA